MRKVSCHYDDPLDLIWVHAAAELGMRIVRSADVFASWDGLSTLTLGTTETLDPDDCMAQMILHEICHAICEFPEGFTQADWGLDNDNPAHRVREHACLRLQAALTGEFGLRNVLAATTAFRRYYDRIPPDPLAVDGDPATEIARAAFARSCFAPWNTALRTALLRTAQLAQLIAPCAGESSLWRRAASTAGADVKSGTAPLDPGRTPGP